MSAVDEAHLAELKKKRTFRKFAYRGVDLDQLLDMSRYTFLFPSYSKFYVSENNSLRCSLVACADVLTED